jgi:hypothetical protein
VFTASIIIALLMKAVRTSETSVYYNETTRRYIPEDSNLHTCRREYLNSRRKKIFPLQFAGSKTVQENAESIERAVTSDGSW